MLLQWFLQLPLHLLLLQHLQYHQFQCLQTVHLFGRLHHLLHHQGKKVHLQQSLLRVPQKVALLILPPALRQEEPVTLRRLLMSELFLPFLVPLRTDFLHHRRQRQQDYLLQYLPQYLPGCSLRKHRELDRRGYR